MKMRGRLASRKKIPPALSRAKIPNPSTSTEGDRLKARSIACASSSLLILVRPERPLLAGFDDSQTWQARGLSLAERAYNLTNCAIQLIGRVAKFHSMADPYGSGELGFLHLGQNRSMGKA